MPGKKERKLSEIQELSSVGTLSLWCIVIECEPENLDKNLLIILAIDLGVFGDVFNYRS